MKKAGLLKILVVMGLSLVLAMNLFTTVFAADDNADFDGWSTPEDATSTSTGSTGSSTGSSETSTGSSTGSTSTTSSSSSDSLSTQSTTTTLNTSNDTNDDENNSSINSLAYTGAEDTTVLAVVILLGAVVAGYSLKKIRDYNSL